MIKKALPSVSNFIGMELKFHADEFSILPASVSRFTGNYDFSEEEKYNK